MVFVINIYSEKGKVIKTYKNERNKLLMGTVRHLSELLNLGSDADGESLQTTISKSWGTLTAVLESFFPEITDDEWEKTDYMEIIEIVKNVMLLAKEQATGIPTEKKKKETSTKNYYTGKKKNPYKHSQKRYF